jgi:hypothetical protein
VAAPDTWVKVREQYIHECFLLWRNFFYNLVQLTSLVAPHNDAYAAAQKRQINSFQNDKNGGQLKADSILTTFIEIFSKCLPFF